MGIFSTSPFDQDVERATSEKNTTEDWGQIMDVCDKVKESSTGGKDCLKSIAKRLNNENPRVVLQTITLLDACINNCGKKILLEVASRDFEQELKKHITSSRVHHKVSERLRECLKRWAETEFKGDSQLSLIPSLYSKLKQDGYDFCLQTESPKKTKFSTDPNVVDSKQEEDDIARAIQLSLQDSGSSSKTSGVLKSSSLYPSTIGGFSSDISSEPLQEDKKARALYDFEAAEDNELTFKAGEIVFITDDSDPNWWKGHNHRGEGLFPANFVTPDLNPELESSRLESSKKVSFSENIEVTEVEAILREEVTGEIDDTKIDRLLHILHEADPTGERPDDPQLPNLEEQVNAMAPTIDAELEQIDRKHAQLARLSTELVSAMNLYHQPYVSGGQFPPQFITPHPHQPGIPMPPYANQTLQHTAIPSHPVGPQHPSEFPAPPPPPQSAAASQDNPVNMFHSYGQFPPQYVSSNTMTSLPHPLPTALPATSSGVSFSPMPPVMQPQQPLL